MLTIYDWHGNYGHPDHIQVHRVGCRAEQMVAGDLPDLRVFEATMNRDEIRRQMAMARGGRCSSSTPTSRTATSIPTVRWTTATRWACPRPS